VSAISLEPDFAKEGESAIPGSVSSVKIALRSFLPSWSVNVTAAPFQGPGGSIPLDRLLIRTPETGGAFVPLDQPVLLARGDLRSPEKEAVLEVAFRSTYEDLPGFYQGSLILTPALPPGPKPPMRTMARPGDDGLGAPQVIRLDAAVNEFINISIRTAELHILGVAGPGLYYAQPDMDFIVTSNARAWSVQVSAADLIGDEGTIDGDRLNWQLIGQQGQILAQGNVGQNPIILTGGPVGIAIHHLRFNLVITLDDPAGDYHGTISLTGMTGS